VTIFNTSGDEKVVSVERISEPQGEEEDEIVDAPAAAEGQGAGDGADT
jgi:DNA gyrase subunit A